MPWSFYREALRLPDAERLHTLRIADANRWTRDDLADYITHRGDPAPMSDAAHDRAAAADTWRGWKVRTRNHHAPHHWTCPQCGFRWAAR